MLKDLRGRLYHNSTAEGKKNISICFLEIKVKFQIRFLSDFFFRRTLLGILTSIRFAFLGTAIGAISASSRMTVIQLNSVVALCQEIMTRYHVTLERVIFCIYIPFLQTLRKLDSPFKRFFLVQYCTLVNQIYD